MSTETKRAEQVSRLAYLADAIAEEADQLDLPMAVYLAGMLREALAEDLRHRRQGRRPAQAEFAGRA